MTPCWKLSLIVTSLTAWAGLGCATTSLSSTTGETAPLSACAQKDWYEVGRHDGAQGTALDVVDGYRKQCKKEFRGQTETMYQNGRNAGLVEYCMPENAHELGRMGVAYKYVCPTMAEADFLAAYTKGQAARKIELENQKLDAEIDALLAQMNSGDTDTYQKREIASEIETLKKERAKNERELSDN